MNKEEQKLNTDENNKMINPIYLTPNSMAVDLFEFKYDKAKRNYELHGLYHEGIRLYLEQKGYFKRYLNEGKAIFIYQEGGLIEEVTSENIRDLVKDYIYSISQNLKFEYGNVGYSIPIDALRTVFLRQANIFFNNNWLEHLTCHETPLLRDTKTECYFVFLNCFVVVTPQGYSIQELNTLKGFCVWKSQCIERNFTTSKTPHESEFAKFCMNVTGGIAQRYEALLSSFGYLLHNYFSPAEVKAVLLYDEAISEQTKPMGGTGKGLCANALKQMRGGTIKIDGKHYQSHNKFKFELIKPGTQIVWIDDPKKDFDFEDLFSCLTDGWTIERKNLPQFIIQAEDSPKVIICSNSILAINGNSNRRRQFIVELNDYYSSKIINGDEKPIEDEHGLLFSSSWSQSDWDNFYSFMLGSVQFYLQKGLSAYELKNVQENYLLQKTCDEFIEWINEKNFKIDEPYSTQELFREFKWRYFGVDADFQQRSFTNWIKLFAEGKKWNYQNKSSNGTTTFKFTTKN